MVCISGGRGGASRQGAKERKCKPREFVSTVFLDIIEHQPGWGTQRRYRLSTIPEKALRMAAIVPGS